MAPHRPEDVDSTEALGRALEAVVVEAYRNGVDVEGSWFVEPAEPDSPAWDVEVWRVEAETHEQ